MLTVIGLGSYAKVILVKKKDNGKIFALKVLKKKKADDVCKCGAIYDACLYSDMSPKGRWICCEDCYIWVHGSCVGWSVERIDTKESYYCFTCIAKAVQTQI